MRAVRGQSGGMPCKVTGQSTITTNEITEMREVGKMPAWGQNARQPYCVTFRFTGALETPPTVTTTDAVPGASCAGTW